MSRVPYLTLEQLQVAARNVLSPSILQSARIDEISEIITGNLVHQLSVYLMADELAPVTKTFSYETFGSWWQHTKAVAFPTFSAWMRRPPRMQRHQVTVNVRNWATFPQATIPYPKELGPVRMYQRTEFASDSPIVSGS